MLKTTLSCDTNWSLQGSLRPFTAAFSHLRLLAPSNLWRKCWGGHRLQVLVMRCVADVAVTLKSDMFIESSSPKVWGPHFHRRFKSCVQMCRSPFHAHVRLLPKTAALPELFCMFLPRTFSCFGLEWLNAFEVLSGPAHEDPKLRSRSISSICWGIWCITTVTVCLQGMEIHLGLWQATFGLQTFCRA